MTTASPSVPETAYRADIQGLRAVAVLSVVLYHADRRLLPGGFIGVDIFFVISGFLITGILLRELQQGRMSIAGFYQRRIRRLFPALFVMLAAVLVAGAVLLAPHAYSELAHTALSTVFFVSNFDFYDLSGYFDGAAADKPLLHTWSLAVEEQFYILFPIFLAFAWKRWPKRLPLILVVGGVLALGIGAWGAFKHGTAAFYLTPFRAFELLLGAIVAVYAASIRPGQWLRDAASVVGAVLIAASLVLYNSGTPFPGLAALVPCTGATLIIAAGIGGRSLGGRLLSLPVLTFFGAISYSLYLWHWPVLSLARQYLRGEPNAWQTALLLAAATFAATASWKFIEQPALRRSASRRAVFAWGGAAMAAGALAAGVIMLDDGVPQRFSPRANALFAAAHDNNHRRDECHNDKERHIPYAQNCLFGAPDAAPVVVVWGDSEGAELVVALGQALAPRGQAAMEITSSACPPALDYQLPEFPACIAHNRETLEHLVADQRIRTVVLAANFARYPDEDRARFYAGLTRAVDALTAAGKTVVLDYPFPNLWVEAPATLGVMADRGEALGALGVSRAQYDADNHDAIALLDTLSRRPGVAVFRPTDALCGPSFCPAYRADTGVLYFDGNHMSITGARFALRYFPFSAIPPPATQPGPSQ